MPTVPFAAAPIGVTIASPLPVEEARVALTEGLARRSLVEPEGTERFAVGIEGSVGPAAASAHAFAIDARGVRYLAPGMPSRSSAPIVLAGVLAGVGAGSTFTGTISAPLSRLLWLLPVVSLAIGVVALPALGPVAPLAGVVLAISAVGIFGLMQREALRDAPQLVRGLEALLRHEPLEEPLHSSLDTPPVAGR